MFTLEGITLPNPVEFVRDQIEVSQTNNLLNGTTKRKVTTRKEKFTLTFQYLDVSEVNNILSEFNILTPKTFQVSEDGLTVGPTQVLIDIEGRNYTTGGSEYFEGLVMRLTEIT